MKKIAVIGPESTGKSELSKELARRYGGVWVPEFARTYLEHLDRPYVQWDLAEIARGQLAMEDTVTQAQDEFIICDTNLVVIKIWSDHKYGHTEQWILDSLAERHYDFYLLTYCDIPWAYDPLREHPEMRDYFFNIYEKYLKQNNQPYAVVRGLGDLRTECAVEGLTNAGII
jgi:NadR type nicotinamide-nucleotide adenylyltransferase